MKITLEQRLRAAGGIPAYMRRRRRIEDLEAAFLRELRDVYAAAAAEETDPTEIQRRLQRHAADLDLGPINDLIDRHNRYYPIEANLPIDLRTRTLLDGTEPWKPMPPLTVAALLARVLTAVST